MVKNKLYFFFKDLSADAPFDVTHAFPRGCYYYDARIRSKGYIQSLNHKESVLLQLSKYDEQMIAFCQQFYQFLFSDENLQIEIGTLCTKRRFIVLPTNQT